MFIAADVLRPECPIDLRSVTDHRVIRMSAAVLGPMLMLRACAFECLLKALYLDAGVNQGRGGVA